MIHEIARRRRSPLHIFGVALLLVVALTGLSQCRRVSERVSGADLSSARGARSDRPSCRVRCNDRYRDRLLQERDRHEEALQRCGADPACLAEEHARHRDAIVQLLSERRECQRDCYNEGGGDASR